MALDLNKLEKEVGDLISKTTKEDFMEFLKNEKMDINHPGEGEYLIKRFMPYSHCQWDKELMEWDKREGRYNAIKCAMECFKYHCDENFYEDQPTYQYLESELKKLMGEKT